MGCGGSGAILLVIVEEEKIGGIKDVEYNGGEDQPSKDGSQAIVEYTLMGRRVHLVFFQLKLKFFAYWGS